MKKFTLLLSLLICTTFMYSQNTFPDTGYVGIGTVTPTHPLDIMPGVDTVVIGLGTSIINTFPYSTGFGKDVLFQNTTGVYNTTMGYEALAYNLTGVANTAFGTLSLSNNLSGSTNVAIGSTSMQQNKTGNQNVAVGYGSLFENKGGSDNVAIGFNAMVFNTNASQNVAIGSSALNDNIRGEKNTAIGYFSLRDNFKGNENMAMGYEALYNNIIGNYNTALGSQADVSVGNLNNATAIGYNAQVDASNKVRIGNSSVSSNGGQVSWTAYSDARIKTKVKENVPGLEFINLLKPVTYHFDVDKQNELMGVISNEKVEGMYDIEKIAFTGFLAQDVEAAAKKINYDFSGLDKSGEVLGLRYAEFVVPLVKAVQELDANDEKKDVLDEAQNDAMQSLQMQNVNLENRIAQLEKLITKQGIVLRDETTEEAYKQSAIIENETGVATLSQNVPNPFTGNTSIAYYVPETAQQAHIKIANANGTSLFMADVRLGKGVLDVDASQLSAGTYSYTLIVDGKVIDTKLMVIQ